MKRDKTIKDNTSKEHKQGRQDKTRSHLSLCDGRLSCCCICCQDNPRQAKPSQAKTGRDDTQDKGRGKEKEGRTKKEKFKNGSGKYFSAGAANPV